MVKLFNTWDFKKEEKFLKTPVGIFLLGAFLGELSPDPTDAIHFWIQNHVLNNDSISALNKAIIELFDWYLLTASYFLLLLILAYLLHIRRVSAVKRFTIFGGIISIGIVVGILAKLLSF